MIITPKVRGFICTTTHPFGCQKMVENMTEYVKKVKADNSSTSGESRFKNVLIIGGSTGYGLSSRIAAGFGWKAATLNISLERPYSINPNNNDVKPASPGWYQTAHLEKLLREEGLYAKSIIGDAFSNEVKDLAVEEINIMGKIDLLVYSLASPRRIDPVDGTDYRSVLKTIGNPDTKRTFNSTKDDIVEVEVTPASEEEITATVKVMGGEDWKLWVDRLLKEGLLSPDFLTVAYSYIGPEVTQDIYRNGTIGRAKLHLEKMAQEITQESEIGGQGCIAVNKGLVTQAASAIPVLPLYLSVLYRVMKRKGSHEGCIEQMTRLFLEKIKHFNDGKPGLEVDENGFIRMDDWEMDSEIQKEVSEIMAKIDGSNIDKYCDVAGYDRDFLQLFGFEVEGIDYQADVPNDALKVDIH